MRPRILIPSGIEFHFWSWLCSVIFPINIHALLNLAVSEILLVLVGLGWFGSQCSRGSIYQYRGVIHDKFGSTSRGQHCQVDEVKI